EAVALRAVPINGQAAGTRVFTVETTTGSDFSTGPMVATGRSLDVAIQGSGWLTVQDPDGQEAMTRAGSLQVAGDGTLQLPSGLAVLGDGGPITIPPDAQVSVAPDGTVSVKTPGTTAINAVGRLKLVDPPAQDIVKGLDGLFRLKSGDALQSDENVRVAEGTLEGSNVNVVETMVGMIAAARQFEMQMKLLQTAEQNESSAASLLRS
ncbi:MAG TPA: flagellar basal body rod protein FlgF, partial [Burkholderiaceae bacterium]|nr:flagellar basal body rod protein FlgF [Burkholderiaceae bacterium]